MKYESISVFAYCRGLKKRIKSNKRDARLGIGRSDIFKVSYHGQKNETHGQSVEVYN